jgi:PhnB protein
MRVNTSLHFNGQCEAAFKFYEQRLGGKIEVLLKWGASPLADQVPPEWCDKILHAHMKLADANFIGGDVLTRDYRLPQGFSVLLGIDDQRTARETFAALADGGLVKMPLQKTFWAPLYGVVVDPYGIPWEINYEPTTQSEPPL